MTNDDIQLQGAIPGTATKVNTPPPAGGNHQQQNRGGSSVLGGMARLQQMGAVTTTGNAGTGNTAEVLKLLQNVQKRTENNPGVRKLNLFPHEDVKSMVSLIIAWAVDDNKIYYAPLMIEKLSKPLANSEMPVQGGRDIEVDRPTARYWTPRRQEMVETYLSQMMNNTIKVFNGVSALIVPRIIDITSEDALAPFYDAAYAAIDCRIRDINGLPTSDITAALLSDSSINLVAKYNICPASNFLPLTSGPIVADFNAVLYARQANKPAGWQAGVEGDDEDIGITGIMGYMDFIRKDVQPVMGYQTNGLQPVAGYDPVLVITSSTCLGISSSSNDNLLSQLLALPVILPLIDASTMKWITIFEPFAGDTQNKASIGALGLEHNIYPGVNIGGKPWQPELLQVIPGTDNYGQPDKLTASQIAQIYCGRNVIVAMDILEGGPLEWVQRLFAAAKPGSVEEDIILRELDLFAGDTLFSSAWRASGQPILAAPSTKIHAGYYTDDHGVKHDIRSIDYLTMLITTQGDPVNFDKFAAGFLPGTDHEINMDQKRRILRQVASNFEVTGLYTRIFVNNAFLNALGGLLVRTKCSYTVEGLQDLSVNGGHRAAFNQNFFQPANGAGVFNFHAKTQQTSSTFNRYKSGQGFGG